MGQTNDRTKEDDVNVKFVKLLSQSCSIGLHAVIRIINDDLPSTVEELLDGVFTSVRNLLPKCDRLLTLLP